MKPIYTKLPIKELKVADLNIESNIAPNTGNYKMA